MNDPELALDLRDELQNVPKLAQQYAALILQNGVLADANDQERKGLFHTVLDEIYVKNKKVVAIRPKPNYYNLLCMSPADPTGFGSP